MKGSMENYRDWLLKIFVEDLEKESKENLIALFKFKKEFQICLHTLIKIKSYEYVRECAVLEGKKAMYIGNFKKLTKELFKLLRKIF